MNIDVLCVDSSLKNFYEVVAIQPIDSLIQDDSKDLLKASHITLMIVKDALKCGKKILIPKNLQYSEVKPSDLSILDIDDKLTLVKTSAKRYVLNLLNDNITKVNILNVIDYMQCYMKLMNSGIFITDDNREDKYFEIIEASQSCEEPKQLDENASFEQQYEYSVAKSKYEKSQDNLKTLETYLNAYDQLSMVNFMHKFLHSMLDDIDNANAIEDVDAILEKNEEQIKNYFFKDVK